MEKAVVVRKVEGEPALVQELVEQPLQSEKFPEHGDLLGGVKLPQDSVAM
jgi:hypothetical protein